jgi:hypothetical protein
VRKKGGVNVTPLHPLITAKRVADALIAVINDTPSGAHPDRLYPPLQEYLSRAQFKQTMRLLVEAKRVARRGDRYYPARSEPK